MNLKGRFGYFAWPSVIKLQNGVYMAAASGYRIRHIDPFGRVVASYSSDGELWTPAGVIMDTELDNRDAGLCNLSNGKVLLSTFTAPKDTQINAIPFYENEEFVKKFCADYVNSISDQTYNEKVGGFISESDDGIHFSEPVNIGISAPHGPIQLKNGRILYIGCQKGKNAKDGIWLRYSDDFGKTWSEFKKLPLPENWEKFGWYEPHAIELEDGRVYVAIRVQSKETSPGGISLLPLTMYACESSDGGKTFSVPSPMNCIGSPPHLFKTKAGSVILSYGRREMPMGIRAKISHDNCKTWGEEIILTDDATHIDLGYPSTTELDNGKLLTVYYQSDKQGDNASIRYIIWEE